MAFPLFPGDVAFGVALAFLFGAFAANLHWNIAIVTFFFLGALLFCLFLRSPLWRLCFVLFFAVLCGIWYLGYYEARTETAVQLPFGVRTVFRGVIAEEPQPSERSLILTVRAEPPLSGTVAVFAPLSGDFFYGDEVEVAGIIEAPDPARGGNPAVFAPEMLLRTKQHQGFWLREWLIGLKTVILRVYRQTLPEDAAALLGGIAFGSKVSFTKELKDAMAISGTTHLVAVSGYNVTIVIFAVGSVFGRYFSKRTTFVLSALSLALFILMVGTEASAVRAAIMGFLALVAREVGRPFSMRNAITLTAAGMTLVDPTALTQSMSFVLSFLSLLGIVYVGPPLRARILGDRPSGGVLDWKENAFTTLSAQIAVMPVLLRQFGQFSATAIVANVLVLGTVPFTMFLGLLLAIVGFLSGFLAFFVAKMVGFLLAYQLGVIRLFARLAVPLPLSFNSDLFMALYYLVLAVFIASSRRHVRALEKI